MNNPSIIIQTIQCKRCNHTWVPRTADIRVCPKCKSPYWAKDRKKPKG
ncbi:MAG: hypothetical protein WCW27_01240 [Patescibacteria group bacterium]|jgi:Zn finger protein HypA/HybF involved in hydrogenase expression